VIPEPSPLPASDMPRRTARPRSTRQPIPRPASRPGRSLHHFFDSANLASEGFSCFSDVRSLTVPSSGGKSSGAIDLSTGGRRCWGRRTTRFSIPARRASAAPALRCRTGLLLHLAAGEALANLDSWAHGPYRGDGGRETYLSSLWMEGPCSANPDQAEDGEDDEASFDDETDRAQEVAPVTNITRITREAHRPREHVSGHRPDA
jgi:hypothetical protein